MKVNGFCYGFRREDSVVVGDGLTQRDRQWRYRPVSESRSPSRSPVFQEISHRVGSQEDLSQIMFGRTMGLDE